MAEEKLENINISKLSEILNEELLSKGRGINTYWNNITEKISKKLSFNPEVKKVEVISDLSKILKESPDISLQYFSIKENTEPIINLQNDMLKDNKMLTRTLKYRFYPNNEQKKLFKKCFGAYRYFYNKSIDEIKKIADENKTKEDKKEKQIINFMAIRNKVMIADKKLTNENKWMKEIPNDIRQLSINSAVGSYNSNVALKRKKFDLKMLTKKRNSQVFHCERRTLKVKDNKIKMFVSRLKGKDSILSFRKKKKDELLRIINDVTSEFIIQKEYSKYYLCVIIRKEKIEKISEKQIVALDPGVRSFQTFYSEGECGKIGENLIERINNLNKKIDRLNWIQSWCEAKIKGKTSRRLSLLRTKVKNIVRDSHFKIANFLVNKYEVILLPIFKTQNMVKDSKNSILNRNLMDLAHYKFREKIINKSDSIHGRKVISCSEAFTSKTCGFCGKIDKDLGNKKIYSCCKKNDRDISGARNILLRSLTTFYNKNTGLIDPVNGYLV